MKRAPQFAGSVSLPAGAEAGVGTCRRVQRTRRCGFTLVEILIAIGIFSVVVAAIYACWSAVLRSSKVGLEAAAKAQRTRMAMQILEESLTYTCMHAANADLYWFGGESGSDAMLSFAARLPRSFPRGGKFGDMTLRRLEFSLRPGPNYTHDLVLRQAPLLVRDQETGRAFDEDEINHPYVVAQDVQEAVFQFWDLQEEDWVDEWTQTNQLPPLVRVSLVLKARKGNSEVEQEFTELVSPAARAVPVMAQGAAARQPPGQPGVPPPGQPGVPGQPGLPLVPGQPLPGVPIRR